jgi:hypothetical protein
MSRILTRKRVVLGIVASLAIAAAAYAYWTTTGSGSGTGSVKATNGTISLSGTIDNPLAPGQNSDVTIKATNSGDTALYVTSTTLSNIVAAGACVDSDFSETHTGGKVNHGVVVPAHTTDQVLVAKHNIAFANDTANSQDACKSAGITFSLSSN